MPQNSTHIDIFDTTLRDGEQVPGSQLTTIEKIEIAKALEGLGVNIIEAGFPISSPGDFFSVQEVSKAVTAPTICALSRAIEKDIDVAVDSLRFAKRKRIHTGIGASDIHIQHKFKSTREKILQRGVAAVAYAKKYVEDVEFYTEDAGRADLEYLAKMVEAVIKAGATVVNIPDTTGFCTPETYGAKIRYLKENVSNIHKAKISAHCHNDLGLATSNTLSAIVNGAEQIEVTINGIGERAGNTSLEEVVMILKKHPDLNYTSDIDPKKIYPLSQKVCKLMRMPIQPNKAIVGQNAFAHSSGIHQDGVLKNALNYEIIAPEEIGLEKNSIVLTARSGRSALKDRLLKLGYRTETREELDKIYQRFLEVADKRKIVEDDDLIDLVSNINPSKNLFHLKDMNIKSGLHSLPESSITLSYKDSTCKGTAQGNGPIDATIKAIKKVIKHDIILEEFTVQAFKGGSNDTGKVEMQLLYEDTRYYGRAFNTDIVVAAAMAYINGVNKIAIQLQLT